MRNVAANLSPDLLGLLLQSSSLARTKAEQGTLGPEALLENSSEGQELGGEGFGEGFKDILSMLTFGQGETAPISEGKESVSRPDFVLSENLVAMSLPQSQAQTQELTQAPLTIQTPVQTTIQAQIQTPIRTSIPTPIQTHQTKTDNFFQLPQTNTTVVAREIKQASSQGSNQDLQNILAAARPKVALMKSGQTGTVPEVAVTVPTEEDTAIEMSLLKRDIEQSSIVPTKLTPKTRGLLTGGDFVGLKNGFEQNQLESASQSVLDMKRAIPASYQVEQSKMNILAAKKQNKTDEGTSILTTKSVNVPLNSENVLEKDLNVRRFEPGLKTVNMKGQADLQTRAGLDSKVQDVMGKISDYIVQAKFDKNNSLDVTLRHNDIGQFQMKVSKAVSGPGLDITIRPHSIESQQFFSDNQQSLMKGLSESGLKILDFKVSSSIPGNQLFGESKSDSQSGFAGTTRDQHSFQSHSNNNEQHDSERRRQLWEQARERLETQYA
ncbi:MAG: hypothetical protein HYV97_17110 [Bdellovibrio sp.]|nr:hypothetical protein [Bdellovibrio sp.]